MNRFLGLLLGALFIGSLGSLFVPLSVNAASFADTWISTTDELYVSHTGCNANERIYFSNTMSDIFNDPSYWTTIAGGESTRAEYASNFSTSQSSGAVFVMNNRVGTGASTNNRLIQFIYSNAGFIVNWVGTQAYVSTPVEDDIYSVTVLRTSNCDVRVNYVEIVSNSGSVQPRTIGGSANEQTPTWYDIYSAQGNIDLNLPSDYEGEQIPGINTKENLYPHFNYLVTDKEIKANNDLTQELPDLPEPDEGWQNNEWQIMWYLFKCDEIDDDDIINCPDRETIHSELLDRDEEYNWEVDEYGDYLLVAEFRYQSCYRYASWPATPDNCILNSEHPEYSFVPGRTVYLPIDGMNIVGNTADLDCDVAGYCYDDTRFKECNVVVAIATLSFDDFNYADCLENIMLLTNMLSFDTIKFSNSWVSSGNCYTLGTLGNWLNLDNKQVCPYFSNEVRNTITPFITFMLGLVMIRFIAGRGAHGTMREEI